MTLPAVTGEFRVAMEPDLRFSPSGVAVGRLRCVASSRKKNEGTGEWEDDKTCWVNLLAFKDQAQNMVESFQKSDLVIVVGKLQTEDWEDSNGGKRTSVTIVVDSIGPSTRWAAAGRPIKIDREQQAPAAQQAVDPANNPWVSSGATSSDEPPF